MLIKEVIKDKIHFSECKVDSAEFMRDCAEVQGKKKILAALSHEGRSIDSTVLHM